jgi:hypothetical protein
LEPFIAKLQQSRGLSSYLGVPTPPRTRTGECDEGRDRLKNLAHVACDYIQRIVVETLSKPAVRALDPKALIGTAIKSEDAVVELFTLNYDLLLEQALTESGLEFQDGFSGPIPDFPQLRSWDPQSYDQPGPQVNLFKLHGSLDWWSYPDLFAEVAPPVKVKGDHLHVPDPRPNRLRRWLCPPDRVLLIGVMNKLLMQARGDHFLDLLCLVISGYGFGDKSINGVILEWIARRPNTAVWIVPDPIRTLRHARPATAAFVRAGLRDQVKLIRSRFHDVAWADVEQAFKKPNSGRDLRWFRETSAKP